MAIRSKALDHTFFTSHAQERLKSSLQVGIRSKALDHTFFTSHALERLTQIDMIDMINMI